MPLEDRMRPVRGPSPRFYVYGFKTQEESSTHHTRLGANGESGSGFIPYRGEVIAKNLTADEAQKVLMNLKPEYADYYEIAWTKHLPGQV